MDYKSLLIVAGIAAVVSVGVLYAVNHNSALKDAIEG
ncbi:MAG: hypothetical protein CENE_03294 [Candidatus Celerinatantimonas neptuna]|nr:MAG: hypothetical protein CENE_03294 [Candidatus Celerinatantimonas neptuna]